MHIITGTIFDGTMTYATSLADKQVEMGHRVFIVGNRLPVQTRATFISVPIHNRRYLQRFRNIRVLKSLFKLYEIELVNAHSRAASWLSHYATKKLPVTYVSTIHSFIPERASVKRHNIYGKNIIAVCDEIKKHAEATAPYFKSLDIRVVYNGI